MHFEMEVIAVDAHDVDRPSYVKRFWLLDGLDDLLKASDVVMVTVPITPESRGMISATRLALMKRGSYLVVVSRGGIVDEAALPGLPALGPPRSAPRSTPRLPSRYRPIARSGMPQTC